MLSDADHIRNLLYRYAELIDAGDFGAVGDLFAEAAVDWGGEVTTGAAAVVARFESATRLYEDGTPRTVHLVVNPIIEFDEASGDPPQAAATRSRFMVVQPVGEQALAPIIVGRYEDEFARVDGAWRFTARRYVVDQLGDVSHHLPEALVAMLRNEGSSGR